MKIKQGSCSPQHVPVNSLSAGTCYKLSDGIRPYGNLCLVIYNVPNVPSGQVGHLDLTQNNYFTMAGTTTVFVVDAEVCVK